MDSYEMDTKEKENNPASGDPAEQAEPSAVLASEDEAHNEDSQSEQEAVPLPEPVDTSVEGLPMPESAPKDEPFPANPDAAAAQAGMPDDETPLPDDEDQPALSEAPSEEMSQQAPQADMPKQEPIVVCPRCRNTIPNQNFCPVCAFSLRGLPPAQPQPKSPAMPYGVPPVAVMRPMPYPPAGNRPPQPAVQPVPPAVAMGQNTPYPPSGYAPLPPVMPPQAPPIPHAPPVPPANMGAAIGYVPPAAPPYGIPYPPQYPKPERNGQGLAILGVVLAGFTALCMVVVLIFTILIYANLYGGSASGYYGSNEEFIPPFSDGNNQDPQNDALPQHFVGETIKSNDITYDFNSSRLEQKAGINYVVVNITVQNSSQESFTLTPSLFRLENTAGGAYQYYGKPDTFHDPLEQAVLMPGEKASKDLTYVYTGSVDSDYIPLYVTDQDGNDLFFVYMQLHS